MNKIEFIKSVERGDIFISDDLILFLYDYHFDIFIEMIHMKLIPINDYFIGLCFELRQEILVSLMDHVEFTYPLLQLKNSEGPSSLFYSDETKERNTIIDDPDIRVFLKNRQYGPKRKLIITPEYRDEMGISWLL